MKHALRPVDVSKVQLTEKDLNDPQLQNELLQLQNSTLSPSRSSNKRKLSSISSKGEDSKSVYIIMMITFTIVNIVQDTRNNPLLLFGASTRAALMLQKATKAWALVNGQRDYCTEDDLKFIFPYVLLHRLKFHGGAGNPIEALNNLVFPHLEKLINKRI